MIRHRPKKRWRGRAQARRQPGDGNAPGTATWKGAPRWSGSAARFWSGTKPPWRGLCPARAANASRPQSSGPERRRPPRTPAEALEHAAALAIQIAASKTRSTSAAAHWALNAGTRPAAADQPGSRNHEVLGAARRVDVLFSVLLGVAPPKRAGRMCVNLAIALAELNAGIDAARRSGTVGLRFPEN